MRKSAENISDVTDITKSKTQKERDLVQEEAENSKLVLQNNNSTNNIWSFIHNGKNHKLKHGLACREILI